MTMTKRPITRRQAPVALALAAMLLAGLGCSSDGPREQRSNQGDRFVSGQVSGEREKINLDAVNQAFWATKGNNFQDWMQNFEQRVNQIYEGNDVVSLDASRSNGKFVVAGYVNRDRDPAFQPGDELLFKIEQTGSVANNQVPYQVTGTSQRPYYAGYHGITNSAFMDALIVGAAVNAMSGPRYYTPPTRTMVIRREVSDFRRSSDFGRQRQANSDFTRTTSSRSFGGTGTTSTTGRRNRSWSGSGDTGSSTTSSWSGRRGGTTSDTSTSGSTSSWGGRRSGDSGSTSRGWSSSSTRSSGSTSRRRRR